MELVDGYRVFLSKRQLEEVLAESKDRPTLMIRNFMCAFFDRDILAIGVTALGYM